jgi:phage replication O-like protein O
MEQASPQLEYGHTRIANELLEAIIRYPFSGAELKIVFAVIRKTYGWKRKQAVISYGQISTLTGLNKRYAKKAVKKLLSESVLLKVNLSGRNLFGLNKNYRQWRLGKTRQAGVPEDTTKVSCQTPAGVLQDTSTGVLRDTP